MVRVHTTFQSWQGERSFMSCKYIFHWQYASILWLHITLTWKYAIREKSDARVTFANNHDIFNCLSEQVLNNMHIVWKQSQWLHCLVTTTVWHSSFLHTFPQWLVQTCTPSLNTSTLQVSLTTIVNTFRYSHISCMPKLCHKLKYHRFRSCRTSRNLWL
jgi:hypothetical protein